MPFGFGIGQVRTLVREARNLEQSRSLVIAGPGAQALATALAENGDPRVIAVNGDPPRPVAAIQLLDGPPTDADVTVLRRLARAGVPLLAVQRGRADTHVPYVLPYDVIDAPGGAVPTDRVVRKLVDALPAADAAALAARLPVLRARAERRIVLGTALTNAGIGAAPSVKGAHMPLMSMAQSRMLLELDVAMGHPMPHESEQVARTAGPALAGSIGTGLGLRACYRRSPVRGPLVAAALAFAGTYALGKLRIRL